MKALLLIIFLFSASGEAMGWYDQIHGVLSLKDDTKIMVLTVTSCG